MNCGSPVIKLPIDVQHAKCHMVAVNHMTIAGKMGEGGDVVQKCTALIPKNAEMASCGANLHHIRRNHRQSVQM
jgi:hypothetical protein